MTQLISIIIPTFNRAHVLDRSIKSVMNQTCDNWELIIVDDASTDDTEKVVTGFKNNSIHYIKLIDNKGVSNARNIGIQNAKGTYLAFLDSDDEWLPDKLELQQQVFNNSNNNKLAVVTCGYCVKRKNSEWIWIPTRKGNLLDDFVIGKIKDFQAQCWLIKTEFVKAHHIFFDTLMHSGEDWDFMVQILKAGQLDYTPELLVNIYRNADHRLWSHKRHLDAIKLQIHKYEHDAMFNSKMLAHLFISEANLHIHLNDNPSAIDAIKTARNLKTNIETLRWNLLKNLMTLHLNKGWLYNYLLTRARKYSF